MCTFNSHLGRQPLGHFIPFWKQVKELTVLAIDQTAVVSCHTYHIVILTKFNDKLYISFEDAFFKVKLENEHFIFKPYNFIFNELSFQKFSISPFHFQVLLDELLKVRSDLNIQVEDDLELTFCSNRLNPSIELSRL